MKTNLLVLTVLASTSALASEAQILGGYETDPRDRGRPVRLIASGLGVPDQVFRDAFSNVSPAPGGREPDPRQVARNKAVLLGALQPYGVTNERLDEVSNFYRYRPGPGELWRNRPARIEIEVVNNRVKSIRILDGGFGYSSTPIVRLDRYPELKFKVTLGFGKDLLKNGSITVISLIR